MDKQQIKAYELTSHKTFSIDLSDVDMERTLEQGRGFRGLDHLDISGRKWRGHEIFFKRTEMWKYRVPFFVSERTWEKVVGFNGMEKDTI